MRYRIDHDYHIHSYLSPCSRHPEQTTENILKYARDNGLTSICLTDHYYDAAVSPKLLADSQSTEYDWISQALPLPQAEGISFLFGCEVDMHAYHHVIGVPPARYDDFDFIVVATTHMHCPGATISEEDYRSEERQAALWAERFHAVLNSDLPLKKVGIAHPACTLIHPQSREGYLRVLDRIPTSEMERVFSKAAKAGVGIEINRCDMIFSDAEEDTILRMFRIAKSCGCKFYLGSDAHNPKGLQEAVELFERGITLLDLKESDKFHIS